MKKKRGHGEPIRVRMTEGFGEKLGKIIAKLEADTAHAGIKITPSHAVRYAIGQALAQMEGRNG